jgi:hypothetical protein
MRGIAVGAAAHYAKQLPTRADSPDLAARLKSGDIKLTEWFNELLRLVYRLIFVSVWRIFQLPTNRGL